MNSPRPSDDQIADIAEKIRKGLEKAPDKRSLVSHLAEVGYCCPWGYVALCQARGETISSMAREARLPRETVRFYVHKAQKRQTACLGRSDCLKKVIEEIKAAEPASSN